MAIKAFYSLQPGEAIVAEEIVSRREGVFAFFPHKDVGIDLVVFSELARPKRRSVSIQIKESRYHGNSHSWHQVAEKRLDSCKDTVDVYVFVTYRDVPDGRRVKWKKEFLVVPTADLRRLVKKKHGGKNKIFGFCFAFDEDGKVWDVRETGYAIRRNSQEYTRYYDNWDLIWSR